jgi:hypothetical protein
LILRGACDLVLFDEQGGITDVLRLGDPGGPDPYFVRLEEPVYHTYLLRSEVLFFLEATPGPLDRTLTEYATWSPAEEEPDPAYVQDLRDRVERHGRSRHAPKAELC